MIEIKKEDLNGKGAVNLERLLKLILSSNPSAIRSNIKRDFNISVDGYTDWQIIDFLSKQSLRTDISKTVNVQPTRGFSFIYEGKTITPNPTASDSAKFNLSETLNDIGSVLLGVAGATISGSVLGNVLFPQTTTNQQNTSNNNNNNNNNNNMTTWEKIKSHLMEYKTYYIVGTSLLIVVSIVLYNTYGKKKSSK